MPVISKAVFVSRLLVKINQSEKGKHRFKRCLYWRERTQKSTVSKDLDMNKLAIQSIAGETSLLLGIKQEVKISEPYFYILKNSP